MAVPKLIGASCRAVSDRPRPRPGLARQDQIDTVRADAAGPGPGVVRPLGVRDGKPSDHADLGHATTVTCRRSWASRSAAGLGREGPAGSGAAPREQRRTVTRRRRPIAAGPHARSAVPSPEPAIVLRRRPPPSRPESGGAAARFGPPLNTYRKFSRRRR